MASPAGNSAESFPGLENIVTQLLGCKTQSDARMAVGTGMLVVRSRPNCTDATLHDYLNQMLKLATIQQTGSSSFLLAVDIIQEYRVQIATSDPT